MVRSGMELGSNLVVFIPFVVEPLSLTLTGWNPSDFLFLFNISQSNFAVLESAMTHKLKKSRIIIIKDINFTSTLSTGRLNKNPV